MTGHKFPLKCITVLGAEILISAHHTDWPKPFSWDCNTPVTVTYNDKTKSLKTYLKITFIAQKQTDPLLKLDN